jgi:Flp pilus assembly protein CpaB
LSARNRAILIVTVGVLLIVVGIAASILLINRFNINKQAAQAQTETVKSPVVVLLHDMALGDRLTAADVTINQVPIDVIPRDALTTVADTEGKFIKSDMVQGEMLLQHNVADPTNNNHDLSFILSTDHVLMAFPASDLMSKENVIQRGDIVDIFATFTEDVKKVDTATTATATGVPETPVTRTFTVDAFQKISITALVLDVVQQQNTGVTLNTSGTAADRTQSTISSYLLALNPQDALVLKHLKDKDANFDIVLRAPTSTTQFDLTPVTEEYIVELYGLEILP